MHPPAHESVGQQEPGACWSHQARFFPPPWLATPSQAGVDLIGADLDLPALMRTSDERKGRGEQQIEHDGHHALPAPSGPPTGCIVARSRPSERLRSA